MLDLMRALAATWLLTLPAMAAAAPPDGASSLLRTTLVVADVDRSMGFYGLLGFQPVIIDRASRFRHDQRVRIIQHQ